MDVGYYQIATDTARVYLSLYVVLDLFSRFVVAWMISRKENSALATQLMEEASARYSIKANQLTLHQDRGSPMIAHGYLEMMSELDITCSHSRPRVSNDNAFSESQLKTQKYQPDYPGYFTGDAHANQWCSEYFDWYNFKHHHSGLSGFTPEQVFTGRHIEIARSKQQALDASYARNPNRFVRGRPKEAMPPESVFINPVAPDETGMIGNDRVNLATLTAAGYQSVLFQPPWPVITGVLATLIRMHNNRLFRSSTPTGHQFCRTMTSKIN